MMYEQTSAQAEKPGVGERRMNTEQHGDGWESEILTSQDRVNGFSAQLGDARNITLLKWGKPVAWFSAAVSTKTVRAIVRLIIYCEEGGQTVNK